MKNIVLPSSESNFFDSRQYHSMNRGSGINASYPNPVTFISGLYTTFPSSASSGNAPIFEFDDLDGRFSNAERTISDFQSFNTYIHYYPKKIDDLDNIDQDNMNIDKSLQIPYISSFRISTFIFNPYGVINV
jgi:hypothetical protein